MRMAAVLLGGLLAAAPARGGSGPACVREFAASHAGWVRVDIGDLVPRCGPGIAARGSRGEELPLEAPEACAEAAPARWIPEIERVDEAPGCVDRGLATVCDLLPIEDGHELVGLAIEPEREEAPGFRLYGVDPEVTLLAEGRFSSHAPRPLVLRITTGGRPTRNGRLELYGLHRPPGVRRLGYRVRLGHDPSQVCAYAPQQGRYRLVLGHQAALGEPAPPAAGVVVRRLWVRAPGAVSGQVVRLELPEWISRASGSDAVWGGVRLRADGQWLAYRWLVDGVRAADVEGVRPRPTGKPGLSILDLGSLPARGSHHLQLTAASSAAPFAHEVIVPASPGAVPGEDALLVRWECPFRPPLPCRLDLDLGQRAIASRWIALREGDNRLPEALGITCWRQAQGLTFRWPRRGPVWLETGEPPAGYPGHQLQAPEDLGRGEAWVHGFVEPAPATPWPLQGSLLLAAGALAALLARHRGPARGGEPRR
jgi:hypothetical protein